MTQQPSVTSFGVYQLNRVYCCDALELLAGLPDNAVNCIVTSPPYFGLRDYGTAKWEGGDPNCDHAIGRFETPVSKKQRSNTGSGTMQAKDKCPKCGASRIDMQIGLEETPEAFVAALVGVFREVRRVLREDGTLWLNLGDSYFGSGQGWGDSGGLKAKDLMLIPARVALALQADGWILRADIIWAKPNPMPESVQDRPTKSHEHVFLLAKSASYWYDAEAIKESHTAVPFGGKDKGFAPSAKDHHLSSQSAIRKGDGRMGNPVNGRNKRDVWTINTQPFPGAHFAVMPEELVRLCVLAGCPEGGVTLDMFMGSGTVARVAHRLGRRYIGCDINADYVAMANNSLMQMSMYEAMP